MINKEAVDPELEAKAAMVAQAQAANSIATDSGSSTADLASSAGLSSDEESKAEKQMKL